MRSKSSFDKLLIEIINRKNNARQAKLMPTPVSTPSSTPSVNKSPKITVINQNGEAVSEASSSEENEKLLQKKNYLDYLRLN